MTQLMIDCPDGKTEIKMTEGQNLLSGPGNPTEHHFADAGKVIDRSTRKVANRPVSK